MAYTGPETRAEAFRIATELRIAGISAIVDVDGKSLKSQLRQADRSGVSKVLVVGEDELARGTVVMRDLASSEQKEVARGDVVKEVGGT